MALFRLAWNFSISEIEMAISQPIWIFVCTLNFSLDVHLLISVANKTCWNFPKLFARKIFLRISHARVSLCPNWILRPTLCSGLCLKAFVVKLICQWPGPISKWSSTRVVDQVGKVGEDKLVSKMVKVKILPGLLIIWQA